MIAILCTDDFGGMMFNQRRQSRDSVVTGRILEDATGSTLWMNEYSFGMFDGVAESAGAGNIKVCENFVEKAVSGEHCFFESQSPAEAIGQIEKFIIYRWNRRYPADLFFDVKLLEGWRLSEVEEFAGSSHEKITREVYER